MLLSHGCQQSERDRRHISSPGEVIGLRSCLGRGFLHFEAPVLTTVTSMSFFSHLATGPHPPLTPPYNVSNSIEACWGDHDGHLFRHFPIHLELNHFTGVFVIFKSLMIENGPDVFMPLMETLTIDLHLAPPEDSEPGDLIGRFLLDFVNDRQRRQSPFRELRLSSTTLNALGVEMVASLAALVVVQDIPHDNRHDRASSSGSGESDSEGSTSSGSTA